MTARYERHACATAEAPVGAAEILDAAAAGYFAGYRAAVRDGIVAASLEARVASLLEALAIPVSRARALVECARHETAATYPAADPAQRRAIAALRIIDAIRESVERRGAVT